MSNTTTNMALNDEASRVRPWCVSFYVIFAHAADFDSKPILVHRCSWRLSQEKPLLSSSILRDDQQLQSEDPRQGRVSGFRNIYPGAYPSHLIFDYIVPPD